MPDEPHDPSPAQDPPDDPTANPYDSTVGDVSDMGPVVNAPQGTVGRGTAWTIGGYAASNMLRFAGNLILTRLLFPEAFGLMQIVNALIAGLVLFTDVGIGPAIIQNKQGEEPRFLNTAYAIQNIRGLLLTLGAAALAYPVVLFYRSTDPLAAELLWYLPVAGCSAMIDGLVSTRLFTAQRNLQLEQITKLELRSQFVMIVVMIGWAVLSPSVWALVAGRIAFSITRTTLSHLLLDGARNWPCWDPPSARALFHFGKWIFLSTLLTYLADRISAPILGKVIDMATLGVYGIAANLAILPTGALVRLGGRVFFPAFSRLRERPDELIAEARRVRLPLQLCGGTMLAGMIPGGPALIDFLYDDRYLQAGWMLQLLCLSAWFRILTEPNVAVLLALGRTGWLAACNGVKFAGLVVFVPLGYTLGNQQGQGLLGALLGLMACDVVKYLFATAVIRRLGVKVLLRDLLLGAGVLITSGLGLLVSRALTGHQLHPALVMVATGSAGMVLWLPPVYLWLRRQLSAKLLAVVNRLIVAGLITLALMLGILAVADAL